MAYGTIAGKTKDWSDKEIESAKGGGQFFTPKNNTPTQQTSSTPKASNKSSTPKATPTPTVTQTVTPTPVITTPVNTQTPTLPSAENLWGKNPITSTPIQPSEIAGISGGGSSKKKTTTQPVQPVQPVQYDADPQIASYQKAYQDAEARGDIKAKIDAMEGADNVRIQKGLPALNTDKINQAKEERKTKIANQAKVYSDAYQKAYANKDLQGMLTAATQADDYRESVGEPRQNDTLIRDLQDKLQKFAVPKGTANEDIPMPKVDFGSIPAYEGQYGQVMNSITKELMSDILNPESSPYKGQIETLIKQLQDAQFNYDPSGDTNLQNAINNTSRQVMEQLNRRGILNSTITQEDISNAVANLTGQYSNLAYQRFTDNQTRQFKILDQIQQLDQQFSSDRNNRVQQVQQLANYINGLDAKDYGIFKDQVEQYYKQVETQLTAQKQAVEQQRQKVQDAWDRLKNLGYADNEVSLTLGIAPGTLSKDVQDDIRKYNLELDKMIKELDVKLKEKQVDHEYALALSEQKAANDFKLKQYDKSTVSAETKYIQDQNNNRTYATIQASKDKTAKTNAKNDLKNNYNDTIAEFDGMDSEDALNEILTDPQAFKVGLGSNYNTFLKRYQDKYYNDLKAEWSSMEPQYAARILKQQTKTEGTNMTMEDYYKTRLGSANYNKLLEEKLKDANMALEDVMGTVSSEDRRKQIGNLGN